MKLLDEFGKKNMALNASEDLLEIFRRGYHRGATIFVTNRPLEDWGKILDDHDATSAILDRFLAGGHIIKITGRSYRLKTPRKKSEQQEKNIEKK